MEPFSPACFCTVQIRLRILLPDVADYDTLEDLEVERGTRRSLIVLDDGTKKLVSITGWVLLLQ